MIVVEIPHRFRPTAYRTTPEWFINHVWENESDWLMEHGWYDETPTLEIALEAAGHDLYGLHVFDTIEEAKAYFAAYSGHQHHAALFEISRLAQT